MEESHPFKDRVGEALVSKDMSPENLENMVKVLLLGGNDVEKARGGDKKEENKDSKQLGDFQQIVGEFVPPPFNPLVWAQTLKISTRLARCVRTYARNTVGLGWSIDPIHPVTEDTPKEVREEIKEQTHVLRAFFNRPNPLMPLSEIFYLEKVDEEAVGNGYVEVVRNNGGKIVRLYHVPSVTIRKRIIKDGQNLEVSGFVQIRGSQKRYFKDFGDRRAMDTFTGKYTKTDGEKPLPPDRRATEIIHFLIYDPSSSYYGAPRYAPSATAIAGNRQSAIRNVNFFENDAVPRMALLVSGGKLNAESMQQIEDFVRAKGRGVENAHRVMVVQVEPFKVGFQQQGKVMVDLKPLTVGVTEDASFSQYREANDEEVREIFGLGQIFFKAEGANRANAQVSREITNEQELEPDRLAKEYVINQTIVDDILFQMMGATGDETDEEIDEYRKKIQVRFRFARLTLTDPLDEARMNQMYASLGAITPNELREAIGKPPYPKDYFFADKPLPIAMAELTAGLALAISQKEEEAMPQPEGEMPGMEGMPGMEPGEGEEDEEKPDWWDGDPSTPEETPGGDEERKPDWFEGSRGKKGDIRGIDGIAEVPGMDSPSAPPGAPGAGPAPGEETIPKPGSIGKPPRKPRAPKPTQGIASGHGSRVSSRKNLRDPRAFALLAEMMSDIRKFSFSLNGANFIGGTDGSDR